MCRINTTIPKTSKYCFYFDTPYFYAFRHFKVMMACDKTLSARNDVFIFLKKRKTLPFKDLLRDRIIHFTVGFLLLLPIIGHIVAIANYYLYSPIKTVTVSASVDVPPDYA